MRLNAQTDFSLRILMYLATKSPGHATIQEISTRLRLSQAHLMRIAAKLAAKGFVTSSRGRSGGLELARDAQAITVEDVVRAVEPDFALVGCMEEPEGSCSLEPACRLKGVLGSALDAFMGELRRATLDDLIRSNRAALLAAFQLAGPQLPRRTVRGHDLTQVGGTN